MTPDTGIYEDVPSFILGCTHEIWEDRGVGTKLARYYAQDCIVRAPTGLTTSMAGVAADTLATLHQFPDRELVGEDVIWDDCGDGSFLSSHRLISVMRHTGDGAFGAATGALVKSRIIADCWVKDGIITWETQQTDYPSVGPDSPEYEPRGCPRGAASSNSSLTSTSPPSRPVQRTVSSPSGSLPRTSRVSAKHAIFAQPMNKSAHIDQNSAATRQPRSPRRHIAKSGVRRRLRQFEAGMTKVLK